MLSPNVGEYWYAVGTYTYYTDFDSHRQINQIVDRLVLVKIIKVYDNDTGYMVEVNGGIKRLTNNCLFKKWEPNWFWKLLGYK